MNSEFNLVLKAGELTDQLADKVFEAGFDDSSLTMRGGNSAIWIRHREGELANVVRTALHQAMVGGLHVDHVEIDNDVFASAQ